MLNESRPKANLRAPLDTSLHALCVAFIIGLHGRVSCALGLAVCASSQHWFCGVRSGSPPSHRALSSPPFCYGIASKWESAWMCSFQSSSCEVSPMFKKKKSQGREKEKVFVFKAMQKGGVNSSGRYFQTLAIPWLHCHGVVVVPMTNSDALVLFLCLLNVPGEHQPSCNQRQFCHCSLLSQVSGFLLLLGRDAKERLHSGTAEGRCWCWPQSAAVGAVQI